MLLRTGKKLCYASCKAFGGNEEFASEEMLANEEHEDLDEMREKGNLLKG